MLISKRFFSRDADVVAEDLIGKVIVRKIENKIIKARIVETEAYFGEGDSASWARFGKRKDNIHMWSEPGTILIKNVHKHLMLNFSCGSKGDAQAVLIRAVEPIDSNLRCSGPGLLSLALEVSREMNGKSLFNLESFFIETGSRGKIEKSFRVGVREDLKIPLRFYERGNACVSKKSNRFEKGN